MRKDDDELLSLARLKRNADESTHRKIDTGIKVARSLWGLILITFLVAGWAAAIQINQTQIQKDMKTCRKALNQLYIKMYGVEITFD